MKIIATATVGDSSITIHRVGPRSFTVTVDSPSLLARYSAHLFEECARKQANREWLALKSA